MNDPLKSYVFSFLTLEEIDHSTVNDINILTRQLTSRPDAAIDRSKLIRAVRAGLKVLVVRHGLSIIGMGSICDVSRLTSNVCEIHDLVVDHKYRGQGVADKILSLLVTEGRYHYHADRIELTSHPDRVSANGLYERNGFQLRDTNCYRKTLKY